MALEKIINWHEEDKLREEEGRKEFRKTAAKCIVALLAAVTGGSVPLLIFYKTCAFICSLVPAGAWSALIKVGIVLICLSIGGLFTLFVAVLCALIASVLTAYFLGLLN